MSKKYLCIFTLLMALALLTTRCTPQDGMAQLPVENKGGATEPVSQTISIQNPLSSTLVAVTSSPVTGTLQPGTAPSGNIESTPSSSTGTDEPDRVDLTKWQIYTDDAYHFNISYPPYYIVKHLNNAELAQLSPAPLAAIYFQDQRNDLVEIAPPQFSIRIYENKTQQPIEDWLVAAGLLNREAGWRTEPYRGKNVFGVKALSPNLMAPGWFVYVATGAHVFQLTPLGAEAELMLDTFAIVK